MPEDLSAMRDAYGAPLRPGDSVRVLRGTFAGRVGEVAGFHWRPAYPKVRLTIFGSPTEVSFWRGELERCGGPE